MKAHKEKAKAKDITEIKECPDCGSLNIQHNAEKQQIICLDCGLIYQPLPPEIQQKFEESHEVAPKTTFEVERIMPQPKQAAEKKPSKPKAKKKAVKAAPKPKKKAPAKKKKAPAKSKPAKKKPKKAEKSGFAHRILHKITRIKKSRGSIYF